MSTTTADEPARGGAAPIRRSGPRRDRGSATCELRQRLVLRARRVEGASSARRSTTPSSAASFPRRRRSHRLGCGNPTAVADLNEGEIVLDLGSGGGIDVILSAKRVGPTGIAYGLDMTDEMLALAQQNAREAGVATSTSSRASSRQIPLPANSVDVVISNCVINLSADKPAVLTEIARVLKPGRPDRDHATSSPRIASPPRSALERGELRRLHRRRALHLRVRSGTARPQASKMSSVSFTHEVADGMHGAIVNGTSSQPIPRAKGLPVDPAGRPGWMLLSAQR